MAAHKHLNFLAEVDGDVRSETLRREAHARNTAVDERDEEDEEVDVPTPGGKRRRKRRRKFEVHLLEVGKQERKDVKNPAVYYSIILNCTSRHLQQEKALALAENPLSIEGLKDAIELEFDIPRCTQVMRYKQRVLCDTEAIAHYSIKNGATLEVTYLSEGDLQKVRIIANWLHYFETLLKDRHPSISTELGCDGDAVCAMGYTEGLWEVLRENLFYPWGNPRTITNKHFFNQLGGVESVVNILEILLYEPWRTERLRLKMVECELLRTIAAFGSCDEFQKMVNDLDGVGFAVQSFMRVKLRRGMPVVDNSGSPGRREYNDFLLKELVECAMRVLWTFREGTQVHEDITASYEVIEQLITIIHCPSFSTLSGLMAASIISCCAHDPNINKGLCRSNCVDGMLAAAQTRLALGASVADITVFNYLTQVLIAFLVMYLPDYVSKNTYDKMLKFMERFLKVTVPEQVVQRVSEIGLTQDIDIGWQTVLPVLKLAYGRNPREKLTARLLEVSGRRIARLRQYAVDTALFVLYVMLFSRSHREKLMADGHWGYLIALPNHIPASARARCKELFDMLGSNVPLSPPRLSVLARAKMATAYYGLLDAMTISADEMKQELYPARPPRPTPPAPPVPEMPKDSLCYKMSLQ